MTEQQVNDDHADHVAIVGMAGRFPGAGDPEEFWRNIAKGVESITWLSEAELRAAGVSERSIRDPHYVRAATPLEGTEQFDADFFGLTPMEAAILDPQHRLLLECAQTVFDHAGYDPQRLTARTGVYVGVGFPSYLVHNLLPRPDVVEDLGMQRIFFATDKGFAPTRISHKFDLTGPSVGIDTACSTSLVAVHQACRALMAYDCDVALAGGASTVLSNRAGYRYEEGGITSPDGHCRAFDAHAHGTRFGSGVGLVLLKRLDEALAEGDNILAVIRGSAVNNDGSSKAGFTAPSASGQASVITEALAFAETPAETIGYVEAHGTGTLIGDPIEIAGLTRAYREQTDRKQFCALGSVKSNVGHLDAAAGIAGLIKAVQTLRHATLPPAVNFERPNPEIDFEGSPFYVNTELRAWPTSGTPRRAAVSSFGIGGSNAHVVLEEAPPRPVLDPSRPEQLIVVSARTEAALERASLDLAAALAQTDDEALSDVAFTLSSGRRAHSHRRALVCRTTAEAVQALRGEPSTATVAAAVETSALRTVFLFPGQGAQQVRMLAGLYRQEEVFRREVDRCARHAMRRLGRDLREVIYPDGVSGDEEGSALDETWMTQPALFTVSFALAQLWNSWGVRPSAVTGHSLGEYVAATVAGVFTPEDALDLVIDRARLMNDAPPGAMLAVSLKEEAIAPLLGECSLAAVNGPHQCVASGPVAAVEALERRLTAAGTEHRRLRTTHAFHSAMLDTAAEAFERRVARMSLQDPGIPIVSCLTGKVLTSEQVRDPAYWARQMRETVRFDDAVATLAQDPAHLFLEVGPGQTLTPMLRRAGVAAERVVASAGKGGDTRSDTENLLTALGTLFCRGVVIDWDGFWDGERRRRRPLPGYPFERQRYWIDPPEGGPSPRRNPDGGPAPEAESKAGLYHAVRWRRDELPDGVASRAAAGTWLLVGADEEFADALERQAEQAGHSVVRSPLGSRTTSAVDSAPFGPDDAQEINEVLHTLEEQRRFPSLVVLAHHRRRRQDDDGAGALGVAYTAAWCRALASYAADVPVSLAVVAESTLAVGPDEVPAAARAALPGLCKVLARRHQGLAVTCFDVDGSDQLSARAVTTEFMAGFTQPVVVVREGVRHTESYTEQGAVVADQLPERPSCVITDVTTGVGRALALRLADERQARLTLLGHRDLPDRAQWPAWQDPAEGPRLARAAIEREYGEAAGVPDTFADDLLRAERENLAETGPARDRGEAETLLSRLCGSYVYRTLRTAGVVLERGLVHRRAEIAAQMRVLPRFEKFLDFFLQVLHEDGIVRTDGDRVEVLLGPDEVELVDVRTVRERIPEFREVVDFLDHCVAHYPQALSGDIDAVSVLFPDGSSNRLESAFRTLLRGSNYTTCARLLGRVLTQAAQRSPRRPLRILEVGGGKGYLLNVLAAALRGVDIEYWFTDIGSSFVRSAQQAPSGQGFTQWRCQVFDISEDPQEQGLPPYHFDAVVGFDVVHATPHITGTVENLRSLLAPGGLLCLIEAVVSQRWVEMFWGLAEGWWLFADHDVRTTSPLVPLDTWGALLSGLPFAEVHVCPTGAAARESTDYGLILARQPNRPATPRFEVHLADRVQKLLSAQRSRIGTVLELESLGAQVAVERADLSSRDDVRDALASAAARFGGVDALVHTPGTPLPEVGEWPAAGLAREVQRHTADAIALREATADTGVPRLTYVTTATGKDAAVAEAVAAVFDVMVTTGEAEVRCGSVHWKGDGLERLVSAIGRRGVLAVPASRLEGRQTRPAGPGADGDNASPPPEREVETETLAVFRKLFGIDSIRPDDNFHALGGDSLLASQVIARVRRRFSVDLPVRALFDAPTAAGLAAKVREALDGEAHPDVPLVRVERRDLMALSFGQQSLWLAEQVNGRSTTYNIPSAVRLTGELNIDVLRRSLYEVIRRHEVLRTTVHNVDGTPLQRVHQDFSVDIPVREVREEEIDGLAQEHARGIFDLETGPLMKVALLKVAEDDHVLLVNIHHIVADGWSLGVLVRELVTLYSAFAQGKESPLPALAHQYVDFAHWQRTWLEGDVVDRQVAFWLHKLAGAPALLDLPTDRPRPPRQRIRNAVRRFVVQPEVVTRLADLGREEGATLFMVLLAGFKVLLSNHAGTRDVVVGTTNANRTRTAFEQMIGMFVNNLALRTSLDSAPTFRELLARVRQTAVEAFAHQDLPFLNLVDELRAERSPAHAPVFQVLFLLQKLDITLELPGISARTIEVDALHTKFDLTLFMEEQERGTIGTFIYNAELFDESTIDRWIVHLLRILEHAATEPDSPVASLRMETEDEVELQNMVNENSRSAKLKSLRTAKRKTVSIGSTELVKQGFLPGMPQLPLVVEPTGPGIDLAEWLRSSAERIDALLQRHGAVLFRGFNEGSVEHFKTAALAICPTLFPEYGDLPREGTSPHIYQSTPYPPERPIFFHNESSHLSSWPMRQFFSCIVAAPEGGETPIVDCRQVYSRLRPELRKEFRRKGLRYVRNFIESVDVSWQRFFETEDPQVVGRKCVESGMGHAWLTDGRLRIWRDADAVLRHPRTGETVFFNQVALHHASCLDSDTKNALVSLYGEEGLPRNVFWGDGSPIPDEIVSEVREVMDGESQAFSWCEGDILAIDNMLVAHARRPFSGPRKIVVALGDMMHASDCVREDDRTRPTASSPGSC